MGILKRKFSFGEAQIFHLRHHRSATMHSPNVEEHQAEKNQYHRDYADGDNSAEDWVLSPENRYFRGVICHIKMR
jgi:hypothetical protein